MPQSGMQWPSCGRVDVHEPVISYFESTGDADDFHSVVAPYQQLDASALVLTRRLL